METATLSALRARLAGDEPAVLCILAETVGSSPQEAGASMVLFPDTSQAGTLGGGCVEAEVRRRALPLFSAGEARLDRFAMDADYGWDDGLICGGRIAVLACRLDASDLDVFNTWQQARAGGREGAFWIQIEADRVRLGFSECLPEALREVTPSAWNEWRALGLPHFESDGARHLYVEPQARRERLVIAGAGHVGQALARLAARLDFEVVVLDDRPDFASRERFTDAAQLLVARIAETLETLPLDAHTFVVIVTRGHRHDEAALLAVVDRETAYLGMIGSRRKTALIRKDLLEEGVVRERLDRVHAPIGIAIGSRTVEEIAVSIAAQLIDVRARRRKTRAAVCGGAS